MKFFYRVLSYTVVVAFLFAPVASLAQYTKSFKVTGYYSPVVGQQKYVLGSYEADIRMNGNGTHGADGTPVFVGMISAPRKYAYGTKIFLPGIGMGAVHDRGGAIVAGQNYDRLDVWMGRGDAGRIKAITWGSKMVTGTVYRDENVAANLPVAHPSTPLRDRFSKKYFQNSLWQDRQGMKKLDIKKMQKFLRKQKIYKGRITGEFDDNTWNAVFLFQKDTNILSLKTDDGAGYFGPKTRAKAEQIHQDKKIKKTKKFREFLL